jgi:hypothetical protein
MDYKIFDFDFSSYAIDKEELNKKHMKLASIKEGDYALINKMYEDLIDDIIRAEMLLSYVKFDLTKIEDQFKLSASFLEKKFSIFEWLDTLESQEELEDALFDFCDQIDELVDAMEVFWKNHDLENFAINLLEMKFLFSIVNFIKSKL